MSGVGDICVCGRALESEVHSGAMGGHRFERAVRLTAEQRHALEHASGVVLARYRGRKPPIIPMLESELREEVEAYRRRARANGATIDPVDLYVEEIGGGRFTVTPVVREPLVEITVLIGVASDVPGCGGRGG